MRFRPTSRALIFLRYPGSIAKGFEVRERISAITSLMASGERLSVPNDPSPPSGDAAGQFFAMKSAEGTLNDG